MTAEIAVMNKDAVALAADSAVTSGRKIFTSANKIFALSKYHPVAIMVYDSAHFVGVPWETIIKSYRRELGDISFDDLTQYADSFISYLTNNQSLFPPEAQSEHVRQTALSTFIGIRNRALDELRVALEENDNVSHQQVVAAFERHIQCESNEWKLNTNAQGIPKSHFRKVSSTYSEEIEDAIRTVFQEVDLSTNVRKRLKSLVCRILTRDQRFDGNPMHSGVVIAGFGTADVFPKLLSFDFESIAADRLKYLQHKEKAVKISVQNKAAIIPFAQSEQVRTFIEGLDPQVETFQHDWWRRCLTDATEEVANQLQLTGEGRNNLIDAAVKRCDEIMDDYDKQLRSVKTENFISPVLTVLAMLPKDELAAMAESLVNLTSFKRRVSQDLETVGGPIDVAVISKGDGLIWIQRKHYFDARVNPQFLANYYREEPTGKGMGTRHGEGSE